MKFQIPRSQWLRGCLDPTLSQPTFSTLSRSLDGKTSVGCCVGHFGHTCGVSWNRMENKLTVNDMRRYHSLLPQEFITIDNDFFHLLECIYAVNDWPSEKLSKNYFSLTRPPHPHRITETEREALLFVLWKLMGHDVEFVD